MNTSAPQLLGRLLQQGVELAAWGGRLRYRPESAVDDALRCQLIQHKRELLRLVLNMATPPLPAGTWAQCTSALLAGISDDVKRTRLREEFEERAAICHYEGALNVEDAERIAFLQIYRAVARHGAACR